jgi:hypothetical protein
MQERSAAASIKTALKDGLGILYPCADNAAHCSAGLLEKAVRSLMESGCSAIALSFRDLSADHAVQTGMLVMCHQIVGKLGRKLLVLKERKTVMHSLVDICFFFGIELHESLEECLNHQPIGA